MIFASNTFLFLFLPLFLLVYFLAKPTWRSWIIVFGSYIFYAWWRPDFLVLFIAITYWSYWFGLLVKAQLDGGNKKQAFRFLTIGVVGNLTALGYFKYANFGAQVLASVLERFGLNTFTLEHIILPLGISFYVFQAISYLVDVYRRTAIPPDRFVDFAAFIALFPQLIAGPILRYKDMAPQFQSRKCDLDSFSLGACRFLLGFTKKVLIADNLAPLSTLFLSQGELQLVGAWFGLFVALIQLYFDFSGYSDMAIGLCRMLGFRIEENFNQPYISQSITEFWMRWHMTLASFLRDYVTTPLIRRRKTGTPIAILITMILSGFWHGAAFAFIFWGLFFGVAMILERRFRFATTPTTPYSFRKNVTMMFFLSLSMPLFFTGNLAHSADIYTALFGLNGIGNLNNYLFGASKMSIFFCAPAILWVWLAGWNNIRFYANKRMGNETRYVMRSIKGWNMVLLWTGFLLSLTSLAANSFSPFLYFQF